MEAATELVGQRQASYRTIFFRLFERRRQRNAKFRITFEEHVSKTCLKIYHSTADIRQNVERDIEQEHHPRAQVPIFTHKTKDFELAWFARFASGNRVFDAANNLQSSRAGARMTVV